MKTNIFLEKYFAEKDSKIQLSLLKDYMLSLSPDELKNFIMEPLNFFENALNSSKVSNEKKQQIFSQLDKMIFLLKGKSAAASK